MNQKKRKYKFPLFMLLFIIVLILPSCPFKTQAALASSTIRVGIFELNGFFEKDSDGKPYGYGPDYLNKLSEKTGWNYEYFWTDSWDQCVQALREGKVDLIAPAGKTEERMAEFDFSGFSIGTECGALLSLSTNDNLIFEDFRSFHHLKIGCVESLIFKPAFLDYAQLHGFTPDLVTYKDTRALTAALNAGEVDAILANLFIKTDTSKVLAKFGAEPFYFMLSKGNTMLLRDLDEGLQRIKVEDSAFETDLTIQYWPSFHETPFTKAEWEYIENAPALTVGCRSDSRPVSYLDESTGQVSGMTRDILEEISRISGLNFVYTALPSGNVDYDYLREHQIQLIANVEYNQENIHSAGVKLTNPYLDSKKVFVCNKEELFDPQAHLRLAVSTGSQTLINAIHQIYPNFEIINYGNMEECFQAVRRHETDALLQNQYVVTSYLAKPVYSHMTTIPMEGLEDKLCLSPVIYQQPKTEDSLLADSRLISILNKSIQQIGEQDINKIIIRQTTTNQYRYNINDFLYQYRYFITLTVVILTILTIIVLRSISLKRNSMKLITRNESKLRHITNNINGGVVVLAGTDKLLITYANEGFLELLQYPKDEYSKIKNQEYTAYIHPDNEQTLVELISKDIRDENEVSVKLQIMRRDGKYIPVLFNGTITENEKGEREIYCVIMDISDQERLLGAISLEQSKYRTMIENSGDIIFDLNCRTGELMISHLFEVKFGWEIPENLHYENKYDILRILRLLEEDWDEMGNCMTRVFSEKQGEECTVRIRSKNKENRFCRIYLYPMLDKEENLVYLLGKILDIHEEMLQRKELEEKSRTDPLTGLLNKGTFYEEACAYLKTAKGNTALVFIDVDNFKLINDNLGHMTGDQAIMDTAKKLQIIFSNYDILARFGGDEFCILLKEIPESTLAAKLSWAVEKLRVTYQTNDLSVDSSASIGAVNTYGRSTDLNTLLEHADKALYRAKENGKNQFIIYQEGM